MVPWYPSCIFQNCFYSDQCYRCFIKILKYSEKENLIKSLYILIFQSEFELWLSYHHFGFFYGTQQYVVCYLFECYQVEMEELGIDKTREHYNDGPQL